MTNLYSVKRSAAQDKSLPALKDKSGKRRSGGVAGAKIDIVIEIAALLFTDAVIKAKTHILCLLDEREKASEPPLLEAVSPNGDIDIQYAPNAYVQITDEAMVSAAGSLPPLGEQPTPESVIAADEVHFAAHREIIERTEAMFQRTRKPRPGYAFVNVNCECWRRQFYNLVCTKCFPVQVEEVFTAGGAL